MPTINRRSHYRLARAAWEKGYLLEQMAIGGWDAAKVALDTGIGRTQLYRLLTKHGVSGRAPCLMCGFIFPTKLGRHGCPNCEGEGLY